MKILLLFITFIYINTIANGDITYHYEANYFWEDKAGNISYGDEDYPYVNDFNDGIYHSPSTGRFQINADQNAVTLDWNSPVNYVFWFYDVNLTITVDEPTIITINVYSKNVDENIWSGTESGTYSIDSGHSFSFNQVLEANFISGNLYTNITFTPGSDEDNDGIIDSIDNCYLYNPDQADCNGNGIGDVCDLADFTSYDCDQNSVPDECQPDCDGDGFIDPCDNDSDIDGDGIPDNCESDCNENGIPDDFEIKLGLAQDCNNNNIPDSCDMENGTSTNSATATITFTDPTGSEDVGETIEIISQDGTSITYIGHASSGATDREFNVTISKENSALTLKLCLDHANGHAGKIITVDNGDGTLTLTQVVVGELGNTDITETLTNCTATSFTSGSNSNSVDCDANGEIDTCEIESDPSLDCDNNGTLDSCELTGEQTIEETKLLASDGASGDIFGQSVAISGDTIVVGATYDDDNDNNSGSVYIYKLMQGIWQETKLLPSDGTGSDSFGHSVAISGDTVVVGTPLNDDHGSQSGSAYIYRFDGSNWIETKLTASDGTEGDEFGQSVATSGDTVVVGAYHPYDNEQGNAYIYQFDGSNWIETKLLPSDGASYDYFGNSVSISGDGTTALVGAISSDANGINSGSAYIYELVGNVWQETKLLAGGGGGGDEFGCSVSISGDGTTALVGAIGNDENGAYSGSAYIYELIDSVWQETKIIASDGVSKDYFGNSVSISSDGSTAIVGAYRNSSDSGAYSGSAYIYELIDSVWQETKILASDGEYNDNFGYSVSISSDGTTAISGALYADDNGDNSGSAYVFALPLSADCNDNNILDVCEIEEDPSLDCNQDGILDSCQELDDCDENGIADSCDLQDPINDQNNNGEMDVCECICDITGDGMVNIHDLLILIGSYGSSNPAADFNFDGIVKVHDLLILINAWGACE